MHQGFNPYRDRPADAVCHFCVSFGGWRSGGVWCLSFKILCADGMGCASFQRAPVGDEGEPPKSR